MFTLGKSVKLVLPPLPTRRVNLGWTIRCTYCRGKCSKIIYYRPKEPEVEPYHHPGCILRETIEQGKRIYQYVVRELHKDLRDKFNWLIPVVPSPPRVCLKRYDGPFSRVLYNQIVDKQEIFLETLHDGFYVGPE